MADKEHYTNWHWGDWLKDTATLRPATRGIWVDMIGAMANQRSDRIEGVFSRLQYVLRASMDDIMLAALDLYENNTADVLIENKPVPEWRQSCLEGGGSEMDFIANRMANAWLTVICRRRSKDAELSQNRAIAGKLGAEARWQTDGKSDGKEHGKPMAGSGNGNGIGTPEGDVGGGRNDWIPTPEQLRLGGYFKMRSTTRWSDKEVKAWKAITPISEDDLAVLDKFYGYTRKPTDKFGRHTALLTLLNNFNTALAWAREFKAPKPY